MFWRLKCHACGTRSEHSKGIDKFKCRKCQAWTFVDKDGEYTDPPAQHVAQATQQYATNPTLFTQQGVFCSQCVRNQQIYNDLLSDYLPDEQDRRYEQYVAQLPAYKKELEKKYPQICTACAPKAQSAIHEADYYSMTNNVSRAMRRSLSPVPIRQDTMKKFLARAGLRLVGLAVSVSSLYQVLWHAYAVMQLKQDAWETGTAKSSECIEALSRWVFTWPCVLNGASKLPGLLVLSTCLLWWNPGLIQLYDPHIRIASVAGATQHLVISVAVLLIGVVAWIKLTEDHSPKDLLVGHLGAIFLIVAGHIAASKTIRTERWRVEGSIMPRPEERDVLGQWAGPAQEIRTPRASRTHPAKLLRESFPIEKLARRYPPSPISEGDPMDIEPIPPAEQHTIPVPSWDGLRTNLFGIEDELRAKQQRPTYDDDKHMYIKPFRGRLPAAPISQERRLRNPVSQVHFKQSPKLDLLQQMRDGIERSRGYRRTSDSDNDTAAARTRGQLDLAQSSWDLPGDGGSMLGIEDSFSGARLDDGPPVVIVEKPHGGIVGAAVAAACAVVLAFVLDVGGLRRAVCMSLVGLLEGLGV